MRIINFQIKNYKSIIDSKICYLEDDLTIFAGKNECGKSTILEALESFNVNSEIPQSAKSIINRDTIPEISLQIEFEKNDLINYFSNIKKELSVIKNTYTVNITKIFPNKYIINDEELKFFHLEEYDSEEKIENIKKGILDSSKKIALIHNTYLKTLNFQLYKIDFINLSDTIISVKKYNDFLIKNYQNYIRNAHDRKSMIDELKILIINITELINEIENNDNKNWLVFNNLLPNFILFKTFEDDIPNKIFLNNLEENNFIKDLELISRFDKKIVLSDDDREKSNHKEKVNIAINKDYKEFWSQDETSFEFDWDNEKLLVWIKENSERYRPTERSKGKQWHLSFYIRVSARSNESKSNIILIDEPGMYLHPKAQEDIYNKLKNISTTTQIIFTTHSPYLLRYEEMDRIRLVIKNDNILGSFINQKVHATSDKETLTPIMTAIGLELSNEIHSIDKMNNIIIEGPADFYYLQGIRLLKKDLNFNFIFGGGAGNMPFVGTILLGWGCNVIYLFDNDQGKKDGAKNLQKNWFTKNEVISSIIESEGSIEDFFEKNDFKKFVLEDENIEYDISNSEFVKTLKTDKVLLSRIFLRNVREGKVTLNKISNDNVLKLVKKIQDMFNLVN
jgi:predicted ATP-dependent endonuclease of OLD family